MKGGRAGVNMKAMQEIVKSNGGKWYCNITETARIIGCNRMMAAAFLAEKGVAHHRIGKSKSYFLPDVIEAAEKTKWR